MRNIQLSEYGVTISGHWKRNRNWRHRGRELALLYLLSVGVFSELKADETDSTTRINVQGVRLQSDRMDPLEAGYYSSYLMTKMGATDLIAEIEYRNQISAYYYNIDDPGAGQRWAEARDEDIHYLKQDLFKREGWIEETMAPELFTHFHESLQTLDKALQSRTKFGDIQPFLCSTFHELNSAKIEVNDRPVQSWNSEPTKDFVLNVYFRPLNGPFLLNVTTGQWSLSFVEVTPIGTATFSLSQSQQTTAGTTGPILWRIAIGSHVRYAVTRPNVTLSFPKIMAISSLTQHPQYIDVILSPINSGRENGSEGPGSNINSENVSETLSNSEVTSSVKTRSNTDSYGGIGADLYQDQKTGKISICSFIPKSPAAFSKLRIGDVITCVGMTPLSGQSISEVVAMIRGPVGSNVSVTVNRNGILFTEKIRRKEIVHSASRN